MLHNQLAQNPPTIDNPSHDNLPSWVKFHLGEFDQVKYGPGVVMGHHLVIFVRNEIAYRNEDGYVEDRDSTASLLAFNLEYHSVQSIELERKYLKYGDDYSSFLKYGENQIIKYTPSSSDYSYSFNMICITVESFEPFKVECEGIKDESGAKFSDFTTQIYQDCLYVHGSAKNSDNQLWSFDLESRTWKFCETTGEGPPSKRFTGKNPFNKRIVLCRDPYSFIYQDNLCLYGVLQERSPLGDLFMLDLNSMKWKKIEQKEKYLEGTERYHGGIAGTVYQDHLVTLKPENRGLCKYGNALCLLNLHTKNTWSVFDIKDNAWSSYSEAVTNGLMAYKNLVLGLVADEDDKNLSLAIMDIDNFGISAPKSAEEEYESGLFLNQTESDVTFKIQDQLIPAHKKILMKKSQYFDSLFKSGMAESTQDVIEIQDCEYEVFKEYLRWIYQGTVNTKDANRAIKLYILADKYIQDDLHEKCLNLLTSIINMENVYTILDFAHQENVISLKSWCLKVCKDKLDLLNVVHLVKYLGSKEEDSEFKENNKESRYLALNFVLDNFFALHKNENEKGNFEIYQTFLLKNIEVDTIPPLVHFLYQEYYISEKEKGSFDVFQLEVENKRRKEILESFLTQLKEAVFRFVEENAKIIMKSEMAQDFPNGFFRDLFLYTTENLRDIKTKLKRMEPSHNNDSDGEKHELKKTKKSDPTNGN